MTHQHRTAGDPTAYPYSNCVVNEGDGCNRRAHGNVTLYYECACGAYSYANVNTGSSEETDWIPPSDEHR